MSRDPQFFTHRHAGALLFFLLFVALFTPACALAQGGNFTLDTTTVASRGDVALTANRANLVLLHLLALLQYPQ